MKNTNTARIFISYSHRGEEPKWRAALLHSLHVFEQHHLLDVWQDGKIRVSSFWDDDIKQAMSSARLAVILLTPEALDPRTKADPNYILETEFPFLRDRQQRDKLPIFPVVCEECDWRAHDWLRARQAPNESNPLSQLSELAQDRVFRQLATDIAEELSRVALAELPKPDQPLSPDRVYLDKFPLTRTTGTREEKLIGREQELALLDLAFAQPHTAIVSLVAWGGVGKTMLVQHWLQRLQREGWFGARRVYAWSFYSQGTKEDRQASEDTFLAHALEWFGVQCEPTLSPWDKGRLLADAVARERTLLILDGIEPLQYPPGPMGGQLRARGVQSLLKQLARKANDTEHRGLCLVTTREPLTDLADFQRRSDAAWGSVLRVDLGNLTEEAGAALLHHTGAKRAGAADIKADDAELIAASREVDGHALTLNLLGCFLARAHGGNIRRRDLVKFEEADSTVQGGHTFRMLAAFEKWFAKGGDFGARRLAALRLLGLFDRPADVGCIAALCRSPVIDGLTDALFVFRPDAASGSTSAQPLAEEDWNETVSFLAEFGLLVIQTGQSATNNHEHSLDCHPLIREYFATKLRENNIESCRSGHHRLYTHLSDSTKYQPNSLAGLEPLYHAVAHGCQAGLYEDARATVYRDRILRVVNGLVNYFSTKQLGAFSSDLSAVAWFYRKPWTELIAGFPPLVQSWLYEVASFNLRAVGRLSEAQELSRVSMEFDVERGEWYGAAQSASSLAELAISLGRIDTALAEGLHSIRLSERDSPYTQKVFSATTLADAEFNAGNSINAKNRFAQAEALQTEHEPMFPLLYSLRGFQYCEFQLASSERLAWQIHQGIASRQDQNKGSDQFALIDADAVHACTAVENRTTQTLRWVSMANILKDIGLDQLTLAKAKLFRAIILQDRMMQNSAVPLFDQATSTLQRAGMVRHQPRAHLARAWARFLESNAAAALADLDEAWDIAERGPMRLHLADIHLYRARLFFREKHYPWKSPQDDLAAAEKLISDCGYHRRDEELADAKRAILGQTLM